MFDWETELFTEWYVRETEGDKGLGGAGLSAALLTTDWTPPLRPGFSYHLKSLMDVVLYFTTRQLCVLCELQLFTECCIMGCVVNVNQPLNQEMD